MRAVKALSLTASETTTPPTTSGRGLANNGDAAPGMGHGRRDTGSALPILWAAALFFRSR